MRPALVRLWAAPWSLVGLVLGAGFSYRRRTRGILLCWGAEWPAKLGWGYRAITLGHVVLSVDEPDEELLRHELVHVAQFERWGPLMGPAYLIAALRARAKGGHPYRDNRFEVAARAGRASGSGCRSGGEASG